MLLPGEGADALARGVVRADLVLVAERRVGRDLARDRTNLGRDRVAVRALREQLVDPGPGLVVGRQVVLDEQLAEQHPDPDVRERAEGERPPRPPHEPGDVGVLGLDAVDDAADRLVDEGHPDVLELAHRSEG